jgi:tRNA (guanine10-N2)-dimethyltransferase
VGSGIRSLAVVRCADPANLERAAYTSAVLEHLGTATRQDLPFDPREVVSGTYAVRVHGTQDMALQRALISLVWRGLPEPTTVDLDHPDVELHAFVVQVSPVVRAVWGRLLFGLRASRFTSRSPRGRPFWTSLATEPRLARFMVNLSAAPRGAAVLDPCCGTGSIAIEAALLGFDVHASDVAVRSVTGSQLNFADAALDARVRQLDARHLERWGRRFDAVVSDLPYGRSASIHGVPVPELYRDVLAAVEHVLEPGRRAVLMAAAGSLPAAVGLETLDVFERVVNDGLTRQITVLERRREPR